MKPGEVWSCRESELDPAPWYYLVLDADSDGVDLVLLDSDGEPDCDPGDRIELSWDDIRRDDRRSWLVWELVG